MEHRREPTLSELLDEPIVVALMHRDGITREHIQRLMERIRRSRCEQREPMAA